MSNDLHNELLSHGEDYEPEGSPEELEAAAQDQTGTGPAEEPTGTEPEGDATAPEGTAEADPGQGEVDDEPMTDAEMREHIKKLNNQVNSLQRRLGKNRRRQPAIVAPEPLDESTAPKIESFGTIEEYETARQNWEIDQRVAQGIRKATAGTTDQDQQATRAEFVNDTFADGKAAYPDFMDVVGQQTLPITTEMIDTISHELDSQIVNPEDVFYYLGKNPAEAAALSRMSKPQLARAVTKIEARLEVAKAAAPQGKTASTQPGKKKTVSNAAPPIKPTDSTVIVHKDPDKMTQAEYEAWRMGKAS